MSPYSKYFSYVRTLYANLRFVLKSLQCCCYYNDSLYDYCIYCVRIFVHTCVLFSFLIRLYLLFNLINITISLCIPTYVINLYMQLTVFSEVAIDI